MSPHPPWRPCAASPAPRRRLGVRRAAVAAVGRRRRPPRPTAPVDRGAGWLGRQLHRRLVHNDQYDFDDYGLTDRLRARPRRRSALATTRRSTRDRRRAIADARRQLRRRRRLRSASRTCYAGSRRQGLRARADAAARPDATSAASTWSPSSRAGSRHRPGRSAGSEDEERRVRRLRQHHRPGLRRRRRSPAPAAPGGDGRSSSCSTSSASGASSASTSPPTRRRRPDLRRRPDSREPTTPTPPRSPCSRCRRCRPTTRRSAAAIDDATDWLLERAGSQRRRSGRRATPDAQRQQHRPGRLGAGAETGDVTPARAAATWVRGRQVDDADRLARTELGADRRDRLRRPRHSPQAGMTASTAALEDQWRRATAQALAGSAAGTGRRQWHRSRSIATSGYVQAGTTVTIGAPRVAPGDAVCVYRRRQLAALAVVGTATGVRHSPARPCPGGSHRPASTGRSTGQTASARSWRSRSSTPRSSSVELQVSSSSGAVARS